MARVEESVRAAETKWTCMIGLAVPLLIFFPLSDHTVLAELHGQVRGSTFTARVYSDEEISFAFSLIQILLTHKII